MHSGWGASDSALGGGVQDGYLASQIAGSTGPVRARRGSGKASHSPWGGLAVVLAHSEASRVGVQLHLGCR